VFSSPVNELKKLIVTVKEDHLRNILQRCSRRTPEDYFAKDATRGPLRRIFTGGVRRFSSPVNELKKLIVTVKEDHLRNILQRCSRRTPEDCFVKDATRG
jgi:hypothetical protein